MVKYEVERIVVEYEDWGGGGSIRRRRTVGCRGELRVRTPEGELC